MQSAELFFPIHQRPENSITKLLDCCIESKMQTVFKYCTFVYRVFESPAFVKNDWSSHGKTVGRLVCYMWVLEVMCICALLCRETHRHMNIVFSWAKA